LQEWRGLVFGKTERSTIWAWEIQLNHQSGKVLHVAYRRMDLIESLHNGTFFHDKAKLWIFLPSALVLFVIWTTGIWLFLFPILTKRKRRKRSAP
jgi:hypothetical protein